jgi:hypothetical protein
MPPQVLEALKPEAVVPAMLVLVAQDAPTRTILCAGAGSVEAAQVTLTQGVWLGLGSDSPEQLQAQLVQVMDGANAQVPASGAAQGAHELGRAHQHLA